MKKEIRFNNIKGSFAWSFLIIGILLLSIVSTKAQTDTTAFTYQKPLFDFDYLKPVFKLEDWQSGNKNGMLRYSALSGYREGVKPIPDQIPFERYDDPATGFSRIVMFNLSLAELITQRKLNPNLLVLEVKDPGKYVYDPKYGDRITWMRKNAYCYEYMMPTALIAIQKKGAGYWSPLLWQEDLSSYFNVKVTREKRMVKTWVLVRTSNVDKIKSKGIGERKYDMTGHFNNIEVNRVIGPINTTVKNPLPFVDETSYPGPVDLDLNVSDWKDMAEVRTALQRYDLDLKEEMREVKDIVVIKEIK